MKHLFSKLFVLFIFLIYSCNTSENNKNNNPSSVTKNELSESIDILEKDSITLLDSLSEKKMTLRDYKRGGEFYPEFPLSDNDPLEWPMIYEIALEFQDIKNLDVKNEIFTSVHTYSSYRAIPNPYKWVLGEEEGYGEEDYMIDWAHSDDIQHNLKESELRFVGESVALEYTNPADSIFFYEDIVSKEARLIDSEFDLKWNLGNYPFDVQKLLFEFKAFQDSSVVQLRPSKHFKSTYVENMKNLKEGYRIVGITHRYEYQEQKTELIQVSPDVKRPVVIQSLIFELNVKRKGVVLFFKIFTGGILSYFISCMVFLIPLREFETRVTLAIGGVFGAIGSSAFVYEVLPVVNVFTKADAINNLIILMVVFNILVLLLQKGTYRRYNVEGKYMYEQKEFKFFKKLQDSSSAFFISLLLFFFLLGVILIW